MDKLQAMFIINYLTAMMNNIILAVGLFNLFSFVKILFYLDRFIIILFEGTSVAV